MYGERKDFSVLIGQTFISVSKGEYDGNDAIYFESEDMTYVLGHRQDCCESFWLEDLEGTLESLIGEPIVVAEERSSDMPEASESGTWTFYTLATVKGGHVDIRFGGSSNGYYSETADLMEIE